MDRQKLPQQMVGVTLVTLTLIGCGAPAATPVPSTSTPVPSTATPMAVTPTLTPTAVPPTPAAMAVPAIPTLTPVPRPIGEVEPIPEGCLYMEFFSPSDDSACRRDQSGRISAVITPIGRIEPLLKQWTLEEFEEAVHNNDGSSLNRLYLPGVVAWEYLKRYLQSKDEIWTFGVLDTGFVIIREGKVFCVVVTEHQL